MKNKIITAFAAVLVFALAAVVFAYNNVSNHQTADAKTHCEMMKKHHADKAGSGEHKDCCGANADCCKDGKCCGKKDACPMKQKDAQQQAQTASVDMTNVVVVGDEKGGENCCSTGSDCCKGGSCCKKKS